MGYSAIKDEARAFADRIHRMGFSVYIAAAGTYGFITDETERRVLSFSMNEGGSLSGNYGPPSTVSGTGWRMDRSPASIRSAEDVKELLYAYPPSLAGSGWMHFSTVEQHLKAYGSSSKYTKYEG